MTMKQRQSIIRYTVTGFMLLLVILEQEHLFPTSAASVPDDIFTNRTRQGLQLNVTEVATETASTMLGCEVISPKDAATLFGTVAEQRLNDTVATDQVVFSVDTTSTIQSDCSYIPAEAGTSEYGGLAYSLSRADKASPNEW